MPDYIPKKDDDFEDWLANFAATLTSHGATLGISAPDIALAGTAHSNFSGKHGTAKSRKIDLSTAVADRDSYRETIEPEMRRIRNQCVASPAITEAIKVSGQMVNPGTPIPPGGGIGTLPPPQLVLSFGIRGKMILLWGTNPTNGRLNKVAPGMRGVRIEFKVGGIPPNLNDFDFLDDDNTSPYEHVLNPSVATTIAYRVAWINYQNEVGPYCDPQVGAITP